MNEQDELDLLNHLARQNHAQKLRRRREQRNAQQKQETNFTIGWTLAALVMFFAGYLLGAG